MNFDGEGFVDDGLDLGWLDAEHAEFESGAERGGIHLGAKGPGACFGGDERPLVRGGDGQRELAFLQAEIELVLADSRQVDGELIGAVGFLDPFARRMVV